MLQKGNKVVMHTCGEAEHYEGVIWTCGSNESQMPGGANVVWLDGFSGSFATKYLRKVSTDEIETAAQCVSCDKHILRDSNGYESGESLGEEWCKRCANEEKERIEVEQRVRKSLEQMQVTHTVFKNAHVEKLHLENKRDLAYVEACISDIRIQEGKHPVQEFIVINTDENPQMLEEIIEVMKRYNKWGVK